MLVSRKHLNKELTFLIDDLTEGVMVQSAVNKNGLEHTNKFEGWAILPSETETILQIFNI